MDREIKENDVFRNFKGFKATIIAIAEHTETKEKLVIYKCEAADVDSSLKSDHVDGIYARPLEMFLSEVDHDKYPEVKQKYRFEKIKGDE